MAFIPASSSVVAFQSNPANLQASVTGTVSITGSILSVGSGSVVAFQGTNPWIVTGSVQASLTPAANQSVSGTVGASVIGLTPVSVSNFPTTQNVSGSVVSFINNTPAVSVQGTVFVSGSVITVGSSAPANQSVSGTVGASIIGLPPFVLGGSTNASVITVGTAAPNQSVSGTVLANLNSTNASVITVAQSSVAVAIVSGSIAATFTPPANQSVSGTVQVDIRSSVAVAIISGSIAATFTPPANQSVSGAVSVSNFPTTQNVSGSVVATQGTNPWTVTSSIAGGIFPVSGSVAAVVTNNVTVVSSISGGIFPISGSVAATIVGTPNVNTAGSVVAFQGGAPWLQTFSNSSIITVSSGSVAVAIISGSIAASFTPPANQSVSGTVQTDVRGSIAAVIIGGSIATATTNSSVMLLSGANTIGSVTALQGTNPWIVNFQNSSIIALQAGSVVSLSIGSVITVFQAPSIVGTYAEDAPAASGDKGFLVMGARNDTLSSVTSNDGDYSSHVVGPAGELIAANAPFTKWVSGTGSMLGGTPVTGSLVPIIAAQGSSIFTYITGVQIANASGTNAWITLLGATNSVIGYTVAPANGGSNIYYQNGLKTNANAAFSASISAVASVYVSAQGFTSKT